LVTIVKSGMLIFMSRPLRITTGGYVYHVLNRANGRLRIFRKDGDFLAFEKILAAGVERTAMRICGYCIMGNHWHLVLWPQQDGDLSEFMHWVTSTHTQRYHAAHGTTGIGHVYQGRYKSSPIQTDAHYLTVLRYVEANPLRAGLVKNATLWPWSSLAVRRGRDSVVTLSEGPVDLPSDWLAIVHANFPQADLGRLAGVIQRGAPFGDQSWTATTAQKLNLLSTLRPRGRPRKGA
jgi:putative transposase